MQPWARYARAGRPSAVVVRLRSSRPGPLGGAGLFDLELSAMFLRQLGSRHDDLEDAVFERGLRVVGFDTFRQSQGAIERPHNRVGWRSSLRRFESQHAWHFRDDDVVDEAANAGHVADRAFRLQLLRR